MIQILGQQKILELNPYDKIITYCHDLRYKLILGNDVINYPTKLDLKKFLLCTLSRLCDNSYVYPPTGLSKKISIEDQEISDIWTKYSYNKYLNAHYSSDRKSLIINFKFDYLGNYRFKKYRIPSPLFGNPRTRVVFKFNDVIIYE